LSRAPSLRQRSYTGHSPLWIVASGGLRRGEEMPWQETPAPRRARSAPSRAEIEQGRRQMFEVDEADLELETGFVSCESRPRLPHIADRSRRRAQRSVGRVARPGAPSSPLTGGTEGSNPASSTGESTANLGDRGPLKYRPRHLLQREHHSDIPVISRNRSISCGFRASWLQGNRKSRQAATTVLGNSKNRTWFP